MIKFKDIKVGSTVANERQVGGTHYKSLAIQPWDFIIANQIGYLEGCAIKYLSRWKGKNGLEDLKKAKHFVEKLIETEEARLRENSNGEKK